jgi:hypothetical protein
MAVTLCGAGSFGAFAVPFSVSLSTHVTLGSISDGDASRPLKIISTTKI